MKLKKLILLPTLFLVGTTFSFLSGDRIAAHLFHNKDAKYSGVSLDDEGIKGVYAKPLVVPSDPNYKTQKQYSMSNVGDIESVWDNYTGKGVTIAVIDDGFAPLHPEYKRSDGSSAILDSSRYYYVDSSYSNVYYQEYKTNKDCLNEGYSSSSLDTHGTNTSTTAAAPINGVGGVGIAPDADLLLLKIDMSFLAIKAAISYAIEAGADVINMSLGAYSETFYDGFGTKQSGSSSVATFLNDVCDEAYEKGVIVVAAAGNEATYRKSYPACNNHVIGVGALNKNSDTELAYYTNYNSSNPDEDRNVDILAPGSVYTASVSGYSSSSSSWTYDYKSTQGTSFASPIVAGSAALWLEKYSGEYTGSKLVDAFEEKLTSSASGIGEYKNSYVDATNYGYSKYVSNLTCGRLDVYSLLSGKVEEKPVTPTPEEPETIAVSSVKINEGDISLGIGETSALTASILPENATNQNVSWSIEDTSISSIVGSRLSSSVTIKGNKLGSTNLIVKSEDGNFEDKVKIDVSGDLIQELSLNKKSLTLEEGQSETLKATYSTNDTSSTLLTWSSSDPLIASVDSNGKVTAIKEGNAIISVYNYNKTRVETCDVTITKKIYEEVGEGTIIFNSSTNSYDSYSYLTTSSANQNMIVDETFKNAKVSSISRVTLAKNGYGWKFSSFISNSMSISLGVDLKNAKVKAQVALYPYEYSATFTINNKSTSIKGGTFTTYEFDGISGSTLNISSYGRIYLKSLQIIDENTSEEVVRELSLNKTTLELKEGETETLIATYKVNDNSSTELTWISSNENVVNVDNYGKVTALQEGEAVVYVTNFDYSKIAYCEVKVTKKESEEKPDPTLDSLKGTITFKSTSSRFDGFDYLTTSTANSLISVEEGLENISISSIYRVIQGKNGYGWRLSSLATNGSMNINLNQEVQNMKIKVLIALHPYEDSAKFELNGKSINVTSYNFQEYEFDSITSSTLSLKANGRIYIKSLTIN